MPRTSMVIDVGLVRCQFQCTVARLSVVHIGKVQQPMILEIEISK